MSLPLRHPLGSSLLRELDHLVRPLRGNRPHRLDPEDVARALRINVVWDNLGKNLLGLTLDDQRVLLHIRLKEGQPAKRNFVFAHEVAHVLCRRGWFRAVDRSDEEWFADWFARELTLPRRWLRHHWDLNLVAALHVRRPTLALQLAAVGVAPALMRDRDGVLCRSCGTSFHRWGCACAAVRQDPPAVRDQLPDVRDVTKAAASAAARPIQLTLQPASARSGSTLSLFASS